MALRQKSKRLDCRVEKEAVSSRPKPKESIDGKSFLDHLRKSSIVPTSPWSHTVEKPTTVWS